jgi:hypothetical protein
MNLRVPLNAGKFSSSCTIGSFSRRAQLHEWVSFLSSDLHSKGSLTKWSDVYPTSSKAYTYTDGYDGAVNIISTPEDMLQPHIMTSHHCHMHLELYWGIYSWFGKSRPFSLIVRWLIICVILTEQC